LTVFALEMPKYASFIGLLNQNKNKCVGYPALGFWSLAMIRPKITLIALNQSFVAVFHQV
jgi:hypothetical protein